MRRKEKKEKKKKKRRKKKKRGKKRKGKKKRKKRKKKKKIPSPPPNKKKKKKKNNNNNKQKRCDFVDSQTLKLQESPETIPTGELPRHLVLSCERYLVDRVVPGTRVSIVGVYTTIEGKEDRKRKRGEGGVALRTPYVHAVGIQVFCFVLFCFVLFCFVLFCFVFICLFVN